METNNNLEEFSKQLSDYFLRKYLCKSDEWIGFRSLKNSPNIIDVVVYNNQPWVYNKELHEKSLFWDGNGRCEMVLKKYVETNHVIVVLA